MSLGRAALVCAAQGKSRSMRQLIHFETLLAQISMYALPAYTHHWREFGQSLEVLQLLFINVGFEWLHIELHACWELAVVCHGAEGGCCCWRGKLFLKEKKSP